MLLMFLLSGVAALIYQIVWARELSLVFGVTIYATSAVVTTFMAGLALGSLYFGRVADRWDRPLVLFALLEAGIGAFALAFPLITRVLEPVYVAFYGPLGESHYVMSLVRFGLSFLTFIVPTSLMGGTLPVISRAYVTHARRLGKEVAGLYAWNNFGAFLGCLLAGYAFIELLGVRATMLTAAGLNGVVAMMALWLAARTRPPEPAAGLPAEPAAPEETVAPLPPGVKVALWVFGIEGFTSLAYQMAWTRLLIFWVGTNVYAISVIVATFLMGLSVGAFAVRRWVDRTPDPYRLLGIIEVGIGVTALITIPLLPQMLGLYSGVRGALRGWGWGGWTAGRFALCFAVMLVPTSFMGATMPVVSRIYVPALRRLGRRMGVIGCLDTVGSIFGAFIGAFVLIPVVGIQRTIIATAAVNLALAVWVFAADPVAARPRRRRPGFLLAGAALLLAPLLLLAGPAPLILHAEVGDEVGRYDLLHYSEDAESSVSVLREYGAYHSLYVNQALVAQSTRFDRPSHEMIAHTPLLLHPNPKRVLLIGFGIGFTSWACRTHGVDVDVVELSPGVLRANRWFADQNERVLSDARVNVRVDDGRNYVLGTQQKYDMIQAGIIHPAVSSGNAGFYTRDFYRDCRRILARGGVVCQWIPLHGIPLEDFKMLVRSFQAEFPRTSVWFKHTPDFCTLVGTPGPLEIDFQSVERRVNSPPVREHLARSDVVNVYDFLDSFCVADEALADAIGPGPLHTDDRPHIEFHCQRPISIFAGANVVRFLGENRRRVWPRLANVPPERAEAVRVALERWFAGTQALIRAEHGGAIMGAIGLTHPRYAGVLEATTAAFQRARALNPADRNAAYYEREVRSRHEVSLAEHLLAAGRRQEAVEGLGRAVEMGMDTCGAARAQYLLRPLRGGGSIPARR
jgi:spermidine synthase